MGDLLNKYMIEDLFDVEVKIPNLFHCDMIAIGSGLSSVLTGGKKFTTDYILSRFKKSPFFIWGTGFINYKDIEDNKFLFKNTKILSLRGELTRQRVEQILGHSIDVPLGDGGLLAERWVGSNIKKKYKVGIIPHFKEQESLIIKDLLNHYPNSTLINLKGSPADVIRKIAECEFILSSSLHGLIIADSYHIPNLHIKLYEFGEKMKGDGFKFADYYSSYGLMDASYSISKDKEFPSLDFVLEKYKIDIDDVENKKDAIYNAFKSILR